MLFFFTRIDVYRCRIVFFSLALLVVHFYYFSCSLIEPFFALSRTSFSVSTGCLGTKKKGG